MRVIAFTFLCSLLLLQGAEAHLEGDFVEVGAYRVEFSHVPEKIITTDTTNLVFALENAAAERLPGVPAFVRLSQNDRVLFATTDAITDWSGVVGIAYRFPSSGEYQALVRFSADDTVEHTYTITVPEEPGVPISWNWLALGMVIGMVLGVAGYWVYK